MKGGVYVPYRGVVTHDTAKKVVVEQFTDNNLITNPFFINNNKRFGTSSYDNSTSGGYCVDSNWWLYGRASVDGRSNGIFVQDGYIRQKVSIPLCGSNRKLTLSVDATSRDYNPFIKGVVQVAITDSIEAEELTNIIFEGALMNEGVNSFTFDVPPTEVDPISETPFLVVSIDVHPTMDKEGIINAVKLEIGNTSTLKRVTDLSSNFVNAKESIIGSETYYPLMVNDDYSDSKIPFFPTNITIKSNGLHANAFYGATFNDLADFITIPDDDIVEPGYCYAMRPDGHYEKTSRYLQKNYISIESDTYGFGMGVNQENEKANKLHSSVAGYVLAYVDREYECGTPLTCTEGGRLTEIILEDKRDYPELVIATYWKPEHDEEWGSADRKVNVNGRHWIKVR